MADTRVPVMEVQVPTSARTEMGSMLVGHGDLLGEMPGPGVYDMVYGFIEVSGRQVETRLSPRQTLSCRFLICCLCCHLSPGRLLSSRRSRRVVIWQVVRGRTISD